MSAGLTTRNNSARVTGVGALPAATSKDAALLVSLPPGRYPFEAGGVTRPPASPSWKFPKSPD